MSVEEGMLRNRLNAIIDYRYFVPISLALGIFLRVVWILMVHAPQVSDYLWYFQRAIDISNGKGYSVNGIPTAYWPVGYPGFLGVVYFLLGQSALLGKMINVLLYTAIILLTYSVSKSVFHSERAARITLLVLSFYPNHIAYTAILSTEIFFAFLLLLGAALFISAKQRTGFLLLAGLSWGMATLTKPQAILVPIIFLPLFTTNLRSMLKPGLAVFSMVFLVILPWMRRNYLVVGTTELSTNGGIVLMIGNNPYSTGNQIWNDNVRSLLGNLATDKENMFDGKEVEREAKAKQIAINYIVHNPVRIAILWLRKLRALYLSDVDGFYYSLGMVEAPSGRVQLAYWGLRVLGELYYFLLVAFCFVALPSVLRSGIKQQLIGLFIIVYFTLVYLVFFANARYHFASMPWVAIYSGIGAELMLSSFQAPILASDAQSV